MDDEGNCAQGSISKVAPLGGIEAVSWGFHEILEKMHPLLKITQQILTDFSAVLAGSRVRRVEKCSQKIFKAAC
jgi:hypothetical protein